MLLNDFSNSDSDSTRKKIVKITLHVFYKDFSLEQPFVYKRQFFRDKIISYEAHVLYRRI